MVWWNPTTWTNPFTGLSWSSLNPAQWFSDLTNWITKHFWALFVGYVVDPIVSAIEDIFTTVFNYIFVYPIEWCMNAISGIAVKAGVFSLPLLLILFALIFGGIASLVIALRDVPIPA